MRKEFFNKKSELDLYVVNCGYEDCCPNFVCHPHRRSYYLIHYIVKGSGYYEVNRKKHAVSEGDIFIIYPNEYVSYYSEDRNGEPWSFCWIGFDGEGAEKYLSETFIPKRVHTLSLKDKRFPMYVSGCLDYTEANKNTLSQLELNVHLIRILSLLQKHSSREASKDEPSQIIESAIKYIEFNYMNGITPKDVCAYLYLDRSYVYRLFKKYTGYSPEKYIINFKINKSVDLIKTKKYSLGEIAEFVGISNIYYFSKLFKQTVGITPSEYRSRLL